ncbi:hypothetical protein DLD77_06780 [Chitinophaga alhagiae]|uniref:Anti-sigma factor n=1 Tax=Chitinophaga alhagiae TaxID=2203219 RepID=A0ABM6WBY2_9BACT|nr:hypothetical protein [Chitinophaga alhagiae]AWO01417.1 hypothetical protein DLD77_06780 [Chitinophaga alhagiae]
MNVQEYIDNGLVESYVLGISTPKEKEEIEVLLKASPELRTELQSVERTLHRLLLEDAVPPPMELRARTLAPYNWADTNPQEPGGKKPNYTFINIAPNQNDYITVHRMWKWIFFAAFLLFKFCLFLAIYFYFKYRQVEDRQEEREKVRKEILQSAPQQAAPR